MRVFDMMGNLHEWTSDPTGTFRGGFYVDTVNNNPGCLYRTTAHTTPHWDYSTGFRCRRTQLSAIPSMMNRWSLSLAQG